ncbi:unnamed protein product, partial [Pylaiella littoralis]
MPSTLSKLYHAAARGSVERTVAVLSQGSVDIDGGYGDGGQTPLMVASTMGYLRVVRVLLRLGPRVSVADNDGATALHLSIVNTWHGSVERVTATTDIDRGCGETNQTPLMVASAIGSSRVVRDLLRQGASVSVADSDGYTALHHSVYHKHLAVSKDLIEAGADLEAR